MKKILVDDERDLGAFIPSFLCDWGLNPYEFRVYCRIARRAGNGQCWESIDSIAAGCKINRKTVMKAIASLMKLNMIARSRTDEQKPSSVDKYTLTHHKYWLEVQDPEGQGCPPEGQGCPPEGQGCPPEGQGCPPEGHKGISNKGITNKSKPIKEEEPPTPLRSEAAFVEERQSLQQPPTTLLVKAEVIHEAEKPQSSSIVPAQFDKLEQRKLEQVNHYRRLDSEGIKLSSSELKEWANAEMGDFVRCYRQSGFIFTGGVTDVNNDFAIYVSKQNCKKGQDPSLVHGLNLINKSEADPRCWQKIITWVAEWTRSRELGQEINTAAMYTQQQELQRIHEASKRKFEL